MGRPRSDDREPYECDAEIVAESGSGKAWQVRFDDGRFEWIPKSVIHDDSEVFDGDQNRKGKLVVQAWFAEEKGWE